MDSDRQCMIGENSNGHRSDDCSPIQLFALIGHSTRQINFVRWFYSHQMECTVRCWCWMLWLHWRPSKCQKKKKNKQNVNRPLSLRQQLSEVMFKLSLRFFALHTDGYTHARPKTIHQCLGTGIFSPMLSKYCSKTKTNWNYFSTSTRPTQSTFEIFAHEKL